MAEGARNGVPHGPGRRGRAGRQRGQHGRGSTNTFPNLNTLTKSAGDLLIAICVIYDGNSSTGAEFSGWGGGFTEFGDFGTTTTMAIGCAYKWSTGSETGTFTVTTSDASTTDRQMILLAIPGAHATSPPEAGGYAAGVNANANPGSVTASWGAEDNLWIAVCGCGETATGGAFQGVIGTVSGYTDFFATTQSADVIGGIEAGVAFLQSAVATEDPPAFNTDTSNARWGAITIVVRPAAVTTQDASITSTVVAGSTTIAAATVSGAAQAAPTVVAGSASIPTPLAGHTRSSTPGTSSPTS